MPIDKKFQSRERIFFGMVGTLCHLKPGSKQLLPSVLKWDAHLDGFFILFNAVDEILHIPTARENSCTIA